MSPHRDEERDSERPATSGGEAAQGLAGSGPRPGPDLPGTRRSGLAAAAASDFSLATAVGGPRGVVEAVAPTLLFILCFSLTRNLQTSLVVAVGASALALLARVVTRSSPSQALGGLLGVGVCALFAMRSGEARNFYLPGLLLNAGYAVVLAASTLPTPSFRLAGRVVPRGPFPALGLLLGPMLGEGLSWRHDPRRLRAYRAATLLFAGLFALRLVVQLPLYLTGAVDALGIARLVMGVPAFALTVWLVWRLLRAVPVAKGAGHR
ncbi:MAG: DUF3159 domain-containing protein [Actinomycetes bacterium]